MNKTLRTLFGIFLSALSSLLLTLAFPPYGLWPLIFIGLVPVILAQHRIMPPRLSGVAYGIGIGGFFWGYFGGMFQGGPWFMEGLPVFIALIAGLASHRDRAFHQRTRYRWFVLQGAAVWVGVEMIRGFIPVIGTWGFAAYALYQQPWAIQPSSIFGVYGVSLVILLLNYALALGTLYLFDRQNREAFSPPGVTAQKTTRWLTAVGLVALAWTGLSLIQYQVGIRRPAPTVRSAAVHPAFKVKTEEGVEKLADETRVAAQQGAKLVVWNEGALPFDPQEEHTDTLRDLTEETGVTLVIGYVVQTEQGSRNETTVLTPEGEFLGVYGKDHPVAWSGETSLTRGTYPVFETTWGTLGTIICYDLDFTDTARKVVRNGAQVVAVPSYDWPAIASKHYSHVVFRAVENRTSMIKADIGFDSALIDPYGRILEKQVTPQPEKAVLVSDMPLRTSNPPSLWLGDWIGWLSLAGLVGFTVYDQISARRENNK
jgi:apolipoprotein N-acyltransferase